MIKKIVADNDCGQIFIAGNIPNTMFNFYVLKRKVYKNGSSLWNLCVEYNKNKKKYMVLDSVKGSKEYAIAYLENLINVNKNI